MTVAVGVKHRIHKQISHLSLTLSVASDLGLICLHQGILSKDEIRSDYDGHHEKTKILNMRKQRRRTASR